MAKGQSGFSLLETLIAFAVLSSALVITSQSMGQSVNLELRANESVKLVDDLEYLKLQFESDKSDMLLEGDNIVQVENRHYIVRVLNVEGGLRKVTVLSDDPNRPKVFMESWIWANENR